MPYTSTDHGGNINRTELQPPLEAVVRTFSRCAGYLALALVMAGVVIILF